MTLEAIVNAEMKRRWPEEQQATINRVESAEKIVGQGHREHESHVLECVSDEVDEGKGTDRRR